VISQQTETGSAERFPFRFFLRQMAQLRYTSKYSDTVSSKRLTRVESRF
jgi:hypothetical protein